MSAPFRLRHFASAETKAINAKQEADIRGCMTGYDERFAIMDKMGVDMQLLMPPPPQCYHTVALEYAVPAARMINEGVAELVSATQGSLHSVRHRADARWQRGGERARALHEDARFQGYRNSHQCRGQGIIRSHLCAVLKKAEELGALVIIHPNGFHRRAATLASLLQQRHR